MSETTPSSKQQRWFAEEVHCHDVQLKVYLRRTFPSIRDVDDLVQETYLRIWRRQWSRPIESTKSFLYKIVRYLAIDTLRHERRSPIVAVEDLARLDVLDHSPDAADAACTGEEIELLQQAIESLPARCREIVILRKLHGLSQKEIALRMGITERTVEVQGTKGLDRCEAFLRKKGVIRRTGP